MCMKHSAENPFRKYLEYLHEMGELEEDEEKLYNGIGREFLSLLETTLYTVLWIIIAGDINKDSISEYDYFILSERKEKKNEKYINQRYDKRRTHCPDP